ncbi:MAG: NADH-quinone oxidoreductase subunit E, partial [Nitratireductor sp.]
SKSARPKTAAVETSPALKTPSRVKASAHGEKAASVSAPKVDRRAANKADPALEAADKPRKARAAPAKSASAKPQKPSLLDKDRPIGMERPAAPDDLRLISGVGPKIEKTLHELGIFTYAQVARWTKAERAWVDGFLKFHGRIEREDWIKQAKALAKGGEAEYVRVFGKKPR